VRESVLQDSTTTQLTIFQGYYRARFGRTNTILFPWIRSNARVQNKWQSYSIMHNTAPPTLTPVVITNPKRNRGDVGVLERTDLGAWGRVEQPASIGRVLAEQRWVSYEVNEHVMLGVHGQARRKRCRAKTMGPAGEVSCELGGWAHARGGRV